MAKHNAANARIKREYFDYLKEAQRRDETSIDPIAKALVRFEVSTGYKDFRTFHREQAKAFKRKLNAETNVRTGRPLARGTVHSILSALRAFFLWLASQPGYKSKIAYSDADYFNLSDKDVRVAKAVRLKPVPSLEQVHHVLGHMPFESDIEKRNRALIAFALLTGARDGALASFNLGHVHLDEGYVEQHGLDVRTKGSKTFVTAFVPVGGDAFAIFEEWCRHLREKLLWCDADPLFPKTEVGVGPNGSFAAVGLGREHWSNAGPIRKIFRNAFEAAGLPYFNPHSFRNTLVQLGERECSTGESFKAFSQNLGHEGVLTTFTSYGKVPAHRQIQLVHDMGRAKSSADHDRLAAALAETLRNFDKTD